MAHADALTLLSDDRGTARDIARWTLAGAVILAAHAGVWVVLQNAPPPAGVEAPPAIEMDLVPPPSGEAQTADAGASAAESQASAESANDAPPEETEKVEDEPETLPELTTDETPPPPEETVTAEAEPEPVEALELPPDLVEVPDDVTPAVALPPEDMVVAKEEEPEQPKPVAKKPEPKRPVERRREPERDQARRPTRQPPPAVNSAAQRAGGASGVASNSGAARAAAADYSRRISALLAANKRYPAAAQAQRLQGRGSIAFTVSRSGGVSGVSVTSSTGHSIIDAEMQATVRRAAGSFPPFPADMPGASKRFTVPMSFTVPR
ncbi:TonB family protein [Methylopila henanensis]|uniref:Protein TonB n=1 Tax=Methylopila henanensis TaxID=873516 RepID=A0ABW4K2V3_9HYPH